MNSRRIGCRPLSLAGFARHGATPWRGSGNGMANRRTIRLLPRIGDIAAIAANATTVRRECLDVSAKIFTSHYSSQQSTRPTTSASDPDLADYSSLIHCTYARLTDRLSPRSRSIFSCNIRAVCSSQTVADIFAMLISCRRNSESRASRLLRTSG